MSLLSVQCILLGKDQKEACCETAFIAWPLLIPGMWWHLTVECKVYLRDMLALPLRICNVPEPVQLGLSRSRFINYFWDIFVPSSLSLGVLPILTLNHFPVWRAGDIYLFLLFYSLLQPMANAQKEKNYWKPLKIYLSQRSTVIIWSYIYFPPRNSTMQI